MLEIIKCEHKSQPRLWLDKKIYQKARQLYSRRKEFKRIEPYFAGIKLIVKEADIDLEYNLYDQYEWFSYKKRTFIFRKMRPIASFVIKGGKAYNPLLACGGIYSSTFYKIFRPDLITRIKIAPYQKDIELLVRNTI